jgi:acylphosphatase
MPADGDPVEQARATLQVWVAGDVQGVGFRVFVYDAARRLGLRGYVRNLPDGRVYVAASGPRKALEELLRLVSRGPTMARVSSVEQAWSEGEADDIGQRFEVRH